MLKIKDYNLFAFKLLPLIFIIIGCLVSLWLFEELRDNKRQSYLDKLRLVGNIVASKEVLLLNGQRQDVFGNNYQFYKSRLQEAVSLVDSNSHMVVVRKVDNDFIALFDSELPTSPKYISPGEKVVFKNIGTGYEVVDGVIRFFVPIVIDKHASQIFLVSEVESLYGLYEAAVPAVLPLFFCLVLAVIFYFIYRSSLSQKEILALRSEYISIAAHDLLSPLTGVKWLCESLPKEGVVDQRLYENVFNEVSRSVSGLIVTVSDLLNASSVDKGKSRVLSLAIVRLDEIIKVSVAALELSAKEKGLNIVLKIAPGKDYSLPLDADKMKRVVTNLVSNAIKYSNRNSEVEVGCDFVNNGFIKLWVKDHGIGIPRNEKQKVFQGYYRAKNAKDLTTQGTGLGLYYVKSVIEAHGGHVYLESAENEGTTITLVIKLPITKLQL